MNDLLEPLARVMFAEIDKRRKILLDAIRRLKEHAHRTKDQNDFHKKYFGVLHEMHEDIVGELEREWIETRTKSKDQP